MRSPFSAELESKPQHKQNRRGWGKRCQNKLSFFFPHHLAVMLRKTCWDKISAEKNDLISLSYLKRDDRNGQHLTLFFRWKREKLFFGMSQTRTLGSSYSEQFGKQMASTRNYPSIASINASTLEQAASKTQKFRTNLKRSFLA